MDNSALQKSAEQARSLIENAWRSSAAVLDLQLEAARSLWAAQARAATLFGAPDCSGMFAVDERSKAPFTGATEQMLAAGRQASDALVQMSQQYGRLFEQQTGQVSEGIRTGMEQMARHAQGNGDADRHIIPATSELATTPRDQKRPGARSN